jgi:uncharacterized membrane protein
MINKFRVGGWFAFMLPILLITDIAILLNTPILRQFLGFIFLMILPGLLILQILKLNNIEFTEKFVLSVGLSISFLMFFGLLVNNSSLSLGYETPLSTAPLLISFNVTFIALAIIGYKINKDLIFSPPNLNLSTSEKAFLIVPVFFPALGILGTHVMNMMDNNTILMFLLYLIPIYVASICIFNQKLPERMYPVVIFLISISLLLLWSFRSNHLIGIDTHAEYYFFQTALNDMFWSVLGRSTLDACLSISLLPTICQSILNVPSEFLFKILHSLIYSVSPLIIYVISKKYIGKFYAFLASCFFMFQHSFLFTAMNARTSLAVLFFALAMMTLFNDRIDASKKKALFIVFMASCVVSHYSTTYIFFFILFGTFIGMTILSKKYTFKKVVSLRMVVLFSVLIFIWYSQVTETAFHAGIDFVKDTLVNLNQFFIEESREGNIQSLHGAEIGEKGIPHKIEFVFTWLTFVFIGIGVITLIRRYKEMSFSELSFKKSAFLKEKFEVGYLVVALLCAGLLVAMIALPFISKGYGIQRLYATGITVLSVFFVIGGIMISKGLKVRAYLIILLVLIPYFLCVTGVTYQIFGYPRAITLNSEGEQYDTLYLHDQESGSMKWLKKYSDSKTIVYTDFYGRFALKSQAGFSSKLIDYHHLVQHRKVDGYIYLRYYNVVNDKLVGRNKSSHIFTSYNLTEYDDVFVGRNNIYNNGGSEVYR